MHIIAHRGFWKTEEEKNTLAAFERAFSNGYGIETDIRDFDGQAVISHNPADKHCLLMTDMLELWKKYGKPALALNVKADGLYLLLEDIFKEYGLTEKNYFLFDSSVPEQYIYIKRGYNIFTRSSEFEETISFWEQSKGVWLDQFTECDHIADTVEKLLVSGKTVSVVSPELHKRDNKAVWELLKKYKDKDNLILCTDTPKEAEEYFK